jgi:predicted nucleic acid-binding protein
MDSSNCVSAISLVETLGYYDLHPLDEKYFLSVFQVLHVIEIDRSVLQKAIEVRRKQKVKLGDSIVAATALFYGLEIYIRNVSDFQKISGITAINPI